MMMIRCVKFWSCSLIIIVRKKKSFFTHSKVVFFLVEKLKAIFLCVFFFVRVVCVFFLCVFFGLIIRKTDRPLCETGLSLSRGESSSP